MSPSPPITCALLRGRRHDGQPVPEARVAGELVIASEDSLWVCQMIERPFLARGYIHGEAALRFISRRSLDRKAPGLAYHPSKSGRGLELAVGSSRCCRDAL